MSQFTVLVISKKSTADVRKLDIEDDTQVVPAFKRLVQDLESIPKFWTTTKSIVLRNTDRKVLARRTEEGWDDI